MKRTSVVLVAAGLTTLLVACSGADGLSIGLGDSGASSSANTNTGNGSASGSGSGDDSNVPLPQEPVSDGGATSPVVSDAAAPPVSFLDAGAIDGEAGMTTGDGSTGVNGCTATDFAANDASGANATRTVDLSEGNGNGHGNGGGNGNNGNGGNGGGDKPICLRIKAGQMITFTANFANAPLEPLGGTTPSPILETKTGDSVMFTFAAAGTFGFTRAAIKTEVGAIDVVP